mgnify:CR=1 FL=1
MLFRSCVFATPEQPEKPDLCDFVPHEIDWQTLPTRTPGPLTDNWAMAQHNVTERATYSATAPASLQQTNQKQPRIHSLLAPSTSKVHQVDFKSRFIYADLVGTRPSAGRRQTYSGPCSCGVGLSCSAPQPKQKKAVTI